MNPPAAPGFAPNATAGVASPIKAADPFDPRPTPTLPRLADYSATGRALYHLWRGDPVVVVDSPPGAGKTTLLVDLVVTLLARTDFHIGIACPTNRGADDVAMRINEACTEAWPSLPSVRDGRELPLYATVPDNRPVAVREGSGGTEKECDATIRVQHYPDFVKSVAGESEQRRRVSVRTLDAWVDPGPDSPEILLIDEAYQTTYSKVLTAIGDTSQILMVGDPGQIGPVITYNTSAWDSAPASPHRRAPEVLRNHEGATVIQMDSTYRLGPETTRAIAGLYDFDFDSKRLPRTLVCNGEALPELRGVQVPRPASANDLDMMGWIARYAASMIGSTVVTTRQDGTPETHTVTGKDVAIVVTRRNQQSGIAAALDGLPNYRGEGITVGTADSLQGGQWHVVVALDGTVGMRPGTATDFHHSPGRTCVMASRHMTHLTWVHDGTYRDVLTSADDEGQADSAVLNLRESLLAGEHLRLSDFGPGATLA